ncbi:unnamed protein product [Rodentolepis nana]|uniref:FERM_C domain-containing protein n=1 Tax=Rodentolepis nana TaxID=102285 RepID=A0A0R3TUH4_RODNA|nr:unnamed protein product [Rodentolepis nana]
MPGLWLALSHFFFTTPVTGSLPFTPYLVHEYGPAVIADAIIRGDVSCPESGPHSIQWDDLNVSPERPDRNQELSWVGITAAGIQLFTTNHVERARYTFPWNIIKNVSYRERKFTLKLNMVWRPHKKSFVSSAAPLSSSAGGRGVSTTQDQHTSGHSPSSGLTPREVREGSPSTPGSPVSGKRAPARPPLPPPPASYFSSQSGKYLSATSPSPSHILRGHLVRARSRERPLPSPGG